MPPLAKTVHVQYFALLREERGLSSETWITEAENTRQLFEELQKKHGFSLRSESLRVSVNDQFESWDSCLRENDRVVFVPPVAGG